MAGSSLTLQQCQGLDTGLKALKTCLVLDLDGFITSQGFLAREMGWWCFDDSSRGGSYQYLPKIPYGRLSNSDKNVIKYVQRHIHGLSYYPQASARPHYCLDDDVKELYKKYKTSTLIYVAYKGGTLERDLLQRLNIPCWNLEEAGCPKFERLSRLGTISSCGQHKNFLHHHCPRVECYHFVQWLRRYLNLPYDMNFVDWSRLNRFV